MSAKEMFEELGLEDIEDVIKNGELIKRTYSCKNPTTDYVTFYLKYKRIDVGYSRNVLVEKLQAIYEQCKEFDWLDDE